MGCDIHLYTEIKRHVNDTDMWVNADYWSINPYYKYCDEEDKKWEKELEVVSIYQGRNYELFDILAGVRGSGLNKISAPKGLPVDVCDIVKAESDRWGSDGHSHSYFTLKELIDYLKNNPFSDEAGYLTKEDANLLDTKNILPNDYYFYGENGDFVVYRRWNKPNIITPIIKKLQKRYQEIQYTHVSNQTSVEQEKIRIVFWFDN